MKLGFMKLAQHPKCVAAPLIVPKKPRAMLRMTLDYRLVNAATVKITWPMPYVEAKLDETTASKPYAGNDFCSG